MCIYMSVCLELIKETGRPPGLIFGMWGYFWPGSDKFEFWIKFHTFKNSDPLWPYMISIPI